MKCTKKLNFHFGLILFSETLDFSFKMLEEINCHRMSIGRFGQGIMSARKMLLRNVKTQVIIDAVNRVADLFYKFR